MFEKFAKRCSRRHKQMAFSDAGFLGILRVKKDLNVPKPLICLASLGKLFQSLRAEGR